MHTCLSHIQLFLPVKYASDIKYRYLSKYMEFAKDTVFFPAAGVPIRVSIMVEPLLQADGIQCQECVMCISQSVLPQLVVNWNWSEISETCLITIVNFPSTLALWGLRSPFIFSGQKTTWFGYGGWRY